MNNINYRKFFLRALVIALSVSAAIGIFIFLVGDFGETEMRLLSTTLSVGGFSLTGLCSATIYSRKNLKAFSFLGMLISVLGFLLTAAAIWQITDFENVWQAMLIFIILAVTFGHISLLLLLKPNSKWVKSSLKATIIFICIVALMLIRAALNEFDEEEFFFRLLGAFSILDVLGTIVTPLLNRLSPPKINRRSGKTVT